MKIRIKDNTVRLRLTRSEIDQLGTQGEVSGRTEFIQQDLVYNIVQSATESLVASFVGHKITVGLSAEMIRELVQTERIGFEGQSGKVKLLVEKDFACIDNTTEDQSDNYPNPNLAC
ncbi:MAG: hypothetical protein K0R59_306 [Sphingobacterium sp.]|jgi:hypothetical protein|uniref:DUF7009 family protein n=1 Tax=unclassified Sphingobacterium TaxID=2609468 RepID=UPI00098579A6|nr:hypothetical protein [Sphingobacterium sp. CZ-UAM]MDF2515010.1 hypothetical protein [Sphingobacterium sp.]OOG19182.1 hypothetical protein BWD42_04330 [Sphingobacterium sp. CZ-UAM]